MPNIEEARVKKTNKKYVYIELVKNAKCEGCKVCAFGRKNTLTLPAYSDVPCSPGDSVSIQMPQEEIKPAALFLYVIPLALLLAGFLCGQALGEGLMFLFGGLGLFGGFLIAFFIDKAYRRKRKFLPVILEKINSEKESTDDRP